MAGKSPTCKAAAPKKNKKQCPAVKILKNGDKIAEKIFFADISHRVYNKFIQYVYNFGQNKLNLYIASCRYTNKFLFIYKE